jgi:hypothetical protein
VSRENWFSRALILSARGLACDETWVDIRYSEFVALVCPAHEVLGEDVGTVDRVVSGHRLGCARVKIPVRVTKGHHGVAWILVDDRIPDAVQVFDTNNQGNLFGVTAFITSFIGSIHLSHRVQGLMNISNIVDYKSKGKRMLIFEVGKSGSNPLVVGGTLVVPSVAQHARKSSQCLYDICSRHRERVVRSISSLVVVRNVDVVPVSLPAVVHLFDVVCK